MKEETKCACGGYKIWRSHLKVICQAFGHKMPDNDKTISAGYCDKCVRCGVFTCWGRTTGKEKKVMHRG